MKILSKITDWYNRRREIRDGFKSQYLDIDMMFDEGLSKGSLLSIHYVGDNPDSSSVFNQAEKDAIRDYGGDPAETYMMARILYQ